MVLTNLLITVVSLFPNDRLDIALDQAGGNRIELQSVLDHYTQTGEQQKHAAARFLIENMSGHYYAELLFFDPEDALVEFDALSYENYEAAAEAMSSIEKERGEVHYAKGNVVEDTQTISASYLIENIDLAFKSWKSNPWSKDVSFEDFCEYILPYRGSNEPIENWRGELMQQFANLANEMEDPTDPKEAGRLLEQKANEIIGFDPIFYLHPTDQGFAEMKRRGLGRCEDITNMQMYASRAGGVAVASDYTPHWAKSGNNHAWSVIIGADGKGYAPISGVAAKVYRKTYSEQLDSLGAKLKEGEEAPRWLKKKYYKDVTESYVPVSDVIVALRGDHGEDRFAYLCVFNSGHWKAIQWGELQKNGVIFRDMGRDILYLPAYFRDGEIVQAGTPFVLQKNGELRFVAVPGKEVAIATSESTDRKVAYDDWTDESVQVPLKEGKTYELNSWTPEGWNVLARKVGDGSAMQFDNLSENGLYWLIEVGGAREERPFTIENAEIVRW
ncbi:MAG: hypothetical protein QGI78_06955 [Phycisphaerales bacterium]|jgi:hypothetical protein|nr:hypothetical protein [Phycisphaerales bacterium]